MKTQFVTFSVPLRSPPTVLRDAIEAELRQQGEPLRWAITRVDPVQQQVTVEAVVTSSDPSGQQGGQ